MKKVLFTLAVIAGITAGTMVLSAFTSPKQDVITECSQIDINDGGWEVFRENVAYCTETESCAGVGTVWVKTDKWYQFAFSRGNASQTGKTKWDLGKYTGKKRI